MATITITVVAGPLSVSHDWTLSDANAGRFVAAARINWPPRDDTGAIIVSPSNAEIAREWMRAVISYTKNAVRDAEAKGSPPPDLPMTEV